MNTFSTENSSQTSADKDTSEISSGTATIPTNKKTLAVPLLPHRSRYRSEVDFIDIEVETARTTQGKHVKEHANCSFARPIDPYPSGTARKFILRYQNPRSFRDFSSSLDSLSQFVPLISRDKIHQLEISLDVRIRGASRTDLAAEVASLYREAAFMPSENRRLGSSDGSILFDRVSKPEIIELLATTSSIYVGCQRSLTNFPQDPESLRFYVKVRDNNSDLPKEKWRARMEVTYFGSGLPVTSLDQLEKFDFTSLAKHFKFNVHKDPESLSTYALSFVKLADQVGSRKETRLPNGGVRVKPRYLKANAVRNKRSYDALRGLTSRWAD